MKKILSLFITSLLAFGCASNLSKTDQESSLIKSNKYENKAAIELVGSVSVTGSGNDEPFEEASSKFKEIALLNIDVLDKDDEVIESYTLEKKETSIKGQIINFSKSYIPLSKGTTKFVFEYLDKDKKELFETSKTEEIKENTIYNITANLEQETIEKNPDGEVSLLEVSILELSEKDFIKGELLAKTSKEMTKEDLQLELEKNGFEIKELKNSFGNIYNIKFTNPKVPQALILASDMGIFEFVEVNGVVSIL